MSEVQPFIDNAVQILRDGFANINGNPRGLLIALVATIFMQTWRQWAPIALVAVVVHIAVDVLAPVLSSNRHGDLRLPPLMDQQFWINGGVLFVGYLIVIGVFFLIKNMIFRGGPKAAH